MTPAGKDDERPGGESEDEPEGIRYFDFSDPFELDDAEADPFASIDPAGRETADAANPPTAPEHTKKRPAREYDRTPSRDVFEFALTDLSGSLARPETPAAASPATEPTHKERRSATAFAEEPPAEAQAVTFSTLASFFDPDQHPDEQRARFAAAFDGARAEAGQPFLAVALRMPAGVPSAAQFPLVVQGIRLALHSGDTLLADLDRLRLVAVLPGRGADAARPLFTHLMTYLREHTADADDVGLHIDILTAPDGHPFQRAADFLATAFDGP